MRDQERFVAPKVPVGQPVHHPISERVEQLRAVQLRNADAAALTGLVERRDRHYRWSNKGRVAGVRPVDMKLPEIQRRVRGIEVYKVVRGTWRRAGKPVDIRWEKTVNIHVRYLETLFRGRITRKHVVAIKHADHSSHEAEVIRDILQVCGIVISVRPYTELWVVGKIVVERIGEGVTIVGAGGVGCSGNRYTLQIWSAVLGRAMRHDPAPSR